MFGNAVFRFGAKVLASTRVRPAAKSDMVMRLISIIRNAGHNKAASALLGPFNESVAAATCASC